MRGDITILLTFCLVLSGLAILDQSESARGFENVAAPARGDGNSPLYVGPGQEYATIQSAINAADEWDTIRIFNGTYYERLTIGKRVTLIGNSTEGVIVNGSGGGEVIVITYHDVKLMKMTVEGGKIDDHGDPIFGIRANHWHNSTLTIDGLVMEDLIVRNNKDGIGIHESKFVRLRNLIIINNTKNGLALFKSSDIDVINCTSTLNEGGFAFQVCTGVDLLSSNASFNRGGGVVLGGDPPSYNYMMRDCDVIGNDHTGVYIKSQDCEVINNTINDNGWGSFFIYPDSSDIRILNNRIINNSDINEPDDIKLWSDSNNVSIIGNWIEGHDGFAIYMKDTGGSAPAAYDNLIYYNNFIDNGRDGSQAYDTTGLNRWNTSEYGNYWSDWTSPDADGDGIVDAPYSTEGLGKDHLPFTEPIVSPLILNKDAPTTVPNATNFYYLLEAVDPDNYPSDLTWSLNTNASWLGMNEEHEIRGTPNVRTGVFFVNVSISDGTNSDFYNFTVDVPLFNMAPAIYCFWGDTSGNQYNELNQEIFIYDANSDKTSFEFNIGKDIHIPWGGRHNVSGERYEGYDVDDIEDQLPYHDMIEDLNWGFKVEYFEMREYSIKFWMDLSDQNIWETENGSVNTVEMELAIKVWDDYGGVNTTRANWILHDVNDPPEISGMDYQSAYVNNTYIANFDADDIDSPAANQSWSFNTDATFLNINGTTGVLSGTPSASDIGSFWVSIFISDGEGGVGWFNFTITVAIPGNDVGSLGMMKMEEDGEDSSLSIESIFYGLHLDDLSLISIQADNFTFHIDDNGSVIIVPEENWAGMGLITFSARYGDIYLKRTLLIEIENVNDPPSNARILLPNIEFTEGGYIEGFATVVDPDLPYGESLSIIWSIDGIGQVGTGVYVNFSLPAGTYQLRVVITDSSGATTEAVRTIEIRSEPEIYSPPVWIGMIAAALVVFLITALILCGFYLINRRKDRDSEDVVIDVPMSPMPATPSNAGPGSPPGSEEIVVGGIIDDIIPRSEIDTNDTLMDEDIEQSPPLPEDVIGEGDPALILEEIRTASLMGKRPSDSLPENDDILALAKDRFDEGDISQETLTMIKEILDE